MELQNEVKPLIWGMFCRYIFSRKEYLRSVALHRWVNLPRTLLILSALAVFFAYIAYSGLSDPETQSQIPSSQPEYNSYVIAYYLNFLPVVLIPGLLLLSPLYGYLCYFQAFRKSPFLNKEMTYKIEQEGLLLESSSFQQKVGWAMIGKAREGRNGFILFYGKNIRQYNWLPKSGFATPEDVEKTREIIREHAKNFRKLD